jgi:hypothetical protein
MDKNDLVAFFQELRILYSNTSSIITIKNMKTNKNSNTEWMTKVEDYLAKDNVDLLDIKRMYRFLDKNVKKEDDLEEYENNTDDIDNDAESEYGDETDFS